MGNVDVSSLMRDPDLVSDIQIIRRTPSVDNFGESILKEAGFPTVGVVVPADGKTLNRLPDALRVSGLMSFFVQGQIVSDGKCKYPDIIVYAGERYEVQTVAPWAGLGDLWCEGTCVRQRMAA